MSSTLVNFNDTENTCLVKKQQIVRPESALSQAESYSKGTGGSSSMHGRGMTSLLGTGISSQARRMTTTMGTDEGEDFSPHYPPHYQH